MMVGVGTMLLTVGGDATSKERTAFISGLIFFVLGILLLAVAVGLDWYRRAFGDRKAETERTKAHSTPDAETKELTHTERALIEWLRMNDVPPDVVAQAIREILERRIGR
jgi:hypothetical protein